MKTFSFQKSFLAVAAIGLTLSTLTAVAENSPANSAPPLAYGMPQILQLAQAKLSDDTIVAYIRNSRNSYDLNADQIIYFKQQGISENVIIAMLNQPRPAATPAPAPPAVQSGNPYAAQAPDAYAQPAPSSTVYVMPNSQPYYYTSGYPTYYYSQPYYYASYYPYYYYPYCNRYYYPNCGRYYNSYCSHYYPSCGRYYYSGGSCGRPCSTSSFAFGVGGGFHGAAFAGGFHGGTTFHSSVGHTGGGIAFHSSSVGHMGGGIAFHSGGMMHR
jgi:hypothetical protein